MSSLEEAVKSAAKLSAKGVLKTKVVSGAAAKVASQSAKARSTAGVNKTKSKTTPTTGSSAQSSTTSSIKRSTTADALERLRYPKLSDTSDRLVGESS
ncbi:hypothetical protein PR003_g8160 [Phytophthora rubi]|uniref:Uncharacterized protein n=1 Tax=Phytophthora rubi TaxID=129364 RepID=A0A6A3MXY2_9STRA|nr:hypothetical protein PR001_g8134 [Phytophthora rubi]KAE9345034.1 hypothetical protein PR003_g8160 [Phytophthora rubi]